jgi:hypothetical protein
MSKDSAIADGFNWYLVTAEKPDGTHYSKFIVGRSRRKVMKEFKKRLAKSDWKVVDVNYLDSEVTVFAAIHSKRMWGGDE